MSGTTNLGITYIQASQNQKEVTANAAFDALDARISGARQGRPERIVRHQAEHQALEARMIEETVEGVFEDGPPGQLQVLLWTVGTHARTDTGGGNYHPEGGKFVRGHSASW